MPSPSPAPTHPHHRQRVKRQAVSSGAAEGSSTAVAGTSAGEASTSAAPSSAPGTSEVVQRKWSFLPVFGTRFWFGLGLGVGCVFGLVEWKGRDGAERNHGVRGAMMLGAGIGLPGRIPRSRSSSRMNSARLDLPQRREAGPCARWAAPGLKLRRTRHTPGWRDGRTLARLWLLARGARSRERSVRVMDEVAPRRCSRTWLDRQRTVLRTRSRPAQRRRCLRNYCSTMSLGRARHKRLSARQWLSVNGSSQMKRVLA
jgi:hypothetical protein